MDVAAELVVVPTEVDVVRDVEIETSVGVEVCPCRGHSPEVIRGTGLGGVRERAVAVVAQEPVGTEVGHVQVREAIVVVVGHGNSDSIAGVTGSRGGGDIFYTAIAEVAEESVDQRLVHAEPGGGSFLHQVDVDPTVDVEVQSGQSRAHRLHHVSLTCAAVLMNKGEPHGAGHVGELRP